MPRQPPATLGKICTMSPGFSATSGKAVITRSSFRNTFTNGRRRPASSTTRCRIPGNEDSSDSSMPARFGASRTTSSCPPVYERRADGIRTRTPVRAISSADMRDVTRLPATATSLRRKAFGRRGRSAGAGRGRKGLMLPRSLRARDGYAGNPGRRPPSREAVGSPRRHDDQCSGEGRQAGPDRHRRRPSGPSPREGERLRPGHRAPSDRRQRDPGLPEGARETWGHLAAPRRADPGGRADFDHGIDTVLYIHSDAGALRRLWELYGRDGPKNLVVTGHLASDSIGINVLVRELRARGLRIDTYSGIIDV